MKRLKFASTLVALLIPAACSGTANSPNTPQGVARSELEDAVATIREDQLARHVEVLASDAFRGRFPGSAGEMKTLSYITAHLAGAGASPAVDGLFTQEVPLQRSQVDPKTQLTIAGKDSRTLNWGDDFLAGSGRGEELAQITDAEVVFGGYGIVAPEYGWDDYAEVDLKGKFVLVLGGEPGEEDPKLFEGRALTHHGTRAAKLETAAQRGAAAVFTLRADGEGGLAWQTLATGARAPKYNLATTGKEAAAEIEGVLETSRAAELIADAGKDLEQLTKAAGKSGFRGQSLPLRATMAVKTSIQNEVSHNVVGWIPGRTRPDEYVVYTAHWDHVGTRDHLEGDRIFNGAVDNATGIAALLELAQAYAALGEPPERSIVFIATTAEEQGLLGSFYYTSHPVFPLEQTMAVVNMDALFPYGPFDGMTVVALGSSDLDAYLERAAGKVGRTLHADPSPEFGAFFRSDHYPFAVKGVPALFAVGGPSPDSQPSPQVIAQFQDYMTHRYHQPADEYDAATWNMAGIRQDVEIFFRLGVEVANTTDVPNWRADHAFRSKRDAMLANEAL